MWEAEKAERTKLRTGKKLQKKNKVAEMMKKQVKDTAMSSIRDVGEAESRANAVCKELEEELEVEKTKVQEAQDRVVRP